MLAGGRGRSIPSFPFRRIKTPSIGRAGSDPESLKGVEGGYDVVSFREGWLASLRLRMDGRLGTQ